MSYSNMTVEWTDIVKFTAEGIVIADYNHIRTALVNKFKAIYGEDIDVSTTSADGIYLETLSLMVNNILQAFKSFYSNLDIRTASGTFLDMLCALTNVTRKGTTSSTCSLTITLDSSEAAYTTNNLQFVDNGGIVWKWSSVDSITLTPGQATNIIVTCEKLGPIRADAGTVGNDYADGWICKTVDATPIIKVQQKVSAELGSYAETDNELRARQHNSGNSVANTVLESLAGALLQLSGLEDVLIYNNSTASNQTSLDGTTIIPHSVYVVLRKANNVTVTDKQIGMILHDKMTPGILTSQSNVTAERHHYDYSQYIEGIPVGQTQTYNWREANPAHPNIVITISPNAYFASSGNSTCESIANNIIKEMNALHIGSKVSEFDLLEIVSYSDPLFRGKKTFSIDSTTINGTSNYQLLDTYFNYTTSTITTSGNDYVITIS